MTNTNTYAARTTAALAYAILRADSVKGLAHALIPVIGRYSDSVHGWPFGANRVIDAVLETAYDALGEDLGSWGMMQLPAVLGLIGVRGDADSAGDLCDTDEPTLYEWLLNPGAGDAVDAYVSENGWEVSLAYTISGAQAEQYGRLAEAVYTLLEGMIVTRLDSGWSIGQLKVCAELPYDSRIVLEAEQVKALMARVECPLTGITGAHTVTDGPDLAQVWVTDHPTPYANYAIHQRVY